MVIPVCDRNPVQSRPWVTYSLIAVNVAVFLTGPMAAPRPGEAARQDAYFHHWGVVPAELVAHHHPLSVLTALFVHGSWLHLAGNMLFLYVFGNNVEDHMGRLRFALFYLACGYLAGYGYALAYSSSHHALVGASGAIAGALGAYVCLYPRAKVTSLLPFLFFLPLRLPAWLVLGFWFALQWLALRTAGPGPGVAYLAHVIGFAAGFAYAWAAYRRDADTLGGAARASRGESQP
jgi:membrane associated rhomboid family serine protease